MCLFTDEEEESSSAEEVEEDSPGDLKRSQDKSSTDKCSNEKESEAGAEISALVNYVQPVHFFSFEISKSKCLSIDSWHLMLYVYSMSFSYNNKSTTILGSGQHSRYSDSERAGRSGVRILVGARFSSPVQTGPGAQPPLSSSEVEERVGLYLYSPSGPLWPVLG